MTNTYPHLPEPDAGIVNFYQEKVSCLIQSLRGQKTELVDQDTLMAHVDRSEICAATPLVSIS